jgi:hypothetical protein
MKKIHLIGTRTRDLPACSIVPQPTYGRKKNRLTEKSAQIFVFCWHNVLPKTHLKSNIQLTNANNNALIRLVQQ